MDIGKPEKTIIVEPVEDPFEAPAPIEAPVPEPVRVEPEKVPA